MAMLAPSRNRELVPNIRISAPEAERKQKDNQRKQTAGDQ
jgi:hypothetical protein